MAMSSEVLHLIGAGVGFPIAILMLKRGLVDCEHWDIFSVWAGRHTMTPEEREAADAARRASGNRTTADRCRPRRCSEEIREILGGGQPLLAVRAHQRLSRELPGWVLPRPDLWNLIQALQAQKLWAESVSPMEEYLAHYSEQAAVVRLRLAQVLLAARNARTGRSRCWPRSTPPPWTPASGSSSGSSAPASRSRPDAGG